MKDLLYSIVLFFSIVSIYTAQKINYETPFVNEIGFEDSETFKFIKVDRDMVLNYYKNNLGYQVEEIVNDFKIIEPKLEEGEDEYLMLQVKFKLKNSFVTITSKLLVTNNQIKMVGEECTCESINCNGCEVYRICSCTSCNSYPQGTCKKIHKKTSTESQSFSVD